MIKSFLVVVFLAAAVSAAVMSPLQKTHEALQDSAGIEVFAGSDPTVTGTGSSTDGSSEPTGSTESDEPSDSTPVSTVPTEGPGGNDGLTDGEIAGIVIGSLAGVALIGGGIYYLYYKKKLCFENM